MNTYVNCNELLMLIALYYKEDFTYPNAYML